MGGIIHTINAHTDMIDIQIVIIETMNTDSTTANEDLNIMGNLVDHEITTTSVTDLVMRMRPTMNHVTRTGVTMTRFHAGFGTAMALIKTLQMKAIF